MSRRIPHLTGCPIPTQTSHFCNKYACRAPRYPTCPSPACKMSHRTKNATLLSNLFSHPFLGVRSSPNKTNKTHSRSHATHDRSCSRPRHIMRIACFVCGVTFLSFTVYRECESTAVDLLKASPSMSNQSQYRHFRFKRQKKHKRKLFLVPISPPVRFDGA